MYFFISLGYISGSEAVGSKGVDIFKAGDKNHQAHGIDSELLLGSSPSRFWILIFRIPWEASEK